MPDNVTNKSAAGLIPYLYKFFQALTENQQTIELAMQIQQGLEQGHTAVKYEDLINDQMISNDGKSGYIVQKNGLAGFRRFYNQEQNIRNEFLNSQMIDLDFLQVKKSIKQVLAIIEHKDSTALDLQWQACLSSLQHTRFVLSGGPGTGKTTTVIRMMLLYLGINPDKKIALSAPTGKAANRMIQSINSVLSEINISEKVNVCQQAQTLHRLLGYNHQNNTLKYNQHNPLPYDFIIIDEASMLDVTMTDALLKALKPQAQLLLMGDKNQLPAVEAGNVFADLCELLKPKKVIDLFNYYVHGSEAKYTELSNYIELKKNYRFNQDSVVAQSCASLISQDFEKLKALKNNQFFNWINPISRDAKLAQLKQWYPSISGDETAILLSPVNHGSNSVSELNEMAVKLLYKNHGYNENMPIMVTENDYTLGIFNGDIGYLTKVDDKWQIPFIIEGKIKNIQLDAINKWTIAHAISIHKAQGSEYDHVLIALPNDFELEILTNSLLYTAISRAKKSITIWSNEEIIHKIIKTRESRLTFLK